MKKKVRINRAPVLTLWGTVVAEYLGYSEDEALTLGKAVAGYNAQSKGRKLGIYKDAGEETQGKRRERRGKEEEPETVKILRRAIPVVKGRNGVQAVISDTPITPGSVRRYLETKFGEDLRVVRNAMEDLAASYKPAELEKIAYSLYEEFRPDVPAGAKGWGAQGVLDLERLKSLE